MKKNLLSVAMVVLAAAPVCAQTAFPGGTSKPVFTVTFGHAPQASETGARAFDGSRPASLSAALTSLSFEATTAARRWPLFLGGRTAEQTGDIDWAGLVGDQLRVDGTLHLFRYAMELPTREKILHTRFVDGYVDAVRGYFEGDPRWEDGDPAVGNNFNHPLQGSISSYVYTFNDRRCKGVQYGDPAYWGCLRRATIYSVAASLNWEWNPLMSESALGNVGRYHACAQRKCAGEGGWTDFVMTPVGGLGIRLAGDIARAKLWPVLERRLSDNAAARVLKTALKVATDPGRLAACAFRADFRGALATRPATGRR